MSAEMRSHGVKRGLILACAAIFAALIGGCVAEAPDAGVAGVAAAPTAATLPVIAEVGDAAGMSALLASPAYEDYRRMVLERNPADATALIDGLDDGDPIIRRLAIYGLQRIGDPAAGAAISACLVDGNAWVVRTAATALGELRCADQADKLTALLDDRDLMVRVDAMVALARIGRVDTAGPILAALADRRLWTEVGLWDQMALLHVLERPWFQHPDAEAFLIGMLDYGAWDHPELDSRLPASREHALVMVPARAAAILATKYGNPAGEDLLIRLLAYGDYDAQEAAVALGAIKSRKAVPDLAKVLEGRWAINKRYALAALGAIGGDEAAELALGMTESPDYRVSMAAFGAHSRITGRRYNLWSGPAAAETPEGSPADFDAPGGARPPQFICLGVDDCSNIEGLEAMLDIVETLAAHDRKAVFTMWVAPLASGYQHRDMLKETLLLQRLFDLGCEIAHHTLHHNPGGRNWRSLPHEMQIEEIEGCTRWYRENITGFTRPFTHKGGGGGTGGYLDRDFTRELMARQGFIYGGAYRQKPHPAEWRWPQPADYTTIPVSPLDGSAPPVRVELTDAISGDYPGCFDYEVDQGVAMFMGNLDYRYGLPQRTPLCVNAFHDWGFKDLDDSVCKFSHRNQAAILKQFLLKALVEQSEEYPELHCVTYRQLLEYIRTGDLERTLAIGNGQDSRNPLIAAEQQD